VIAICIVGAASVAPGHTEDRGASALTVSPASLSFTIAGSNITSAAQTLTVSARATTSFTVGASRSWLTVSPSGQLTTNQSLAVKANSGTLAPGSYTGSVRLYANGSTTTVPVTLVVQPAPSLTVNPASLTFNATSGGTAPAAQSLSVTGTTGATFSATASGVSGSVTWLRISPSGNNLPMNTTIAVSVSPGSLAAATYSGSITLVTGGATTTVAVTLVLAAGSTPPPPTGAGYKLIGWNDLGMHCFDGKDYSVFGVLPPYNTIHVHLIDSSGKLVIAPSGYTLSYQAINDPLTNTLNTSSASKTNFWQYATTLGFGSLTPDVGWKGFAMPGASNTSQSMAFNTPDNTWQAVGIPITPFTDSGTVNYFPMMRLSARNSSGTVIATTDIVLPTSDEMTCATCHSSKSVSAAAMPSAGWVNNPDLAKDVKLNILRKHDDRFKTNSAFLSASSLLGYSASGLEATVAARPILCASCHASNALSAAGATGVPPLTTSMHTLHSTVIDPATSQTLDAGTTRASCYNCHPGPKTQCFRGAMSTVKDAAGNNQIECQGCHGTISTVGKAGRQGWLEEPSCQMCHTGTAVNNNGQIAYTSVFTSGTTQRVAVDQTFATNSNTPASGISLYRFSSGHGGLQCEACHNSTHAEYATPISNDNVQSINLQGHSGMMAECTACHSSVPNTVNGGPHGLHPIGSSWVSRHPDVVESGGTTPCQVCHGTDYRGTILSKTKAARSLAGRSFAAGTVIGCYSCHNGPNGG
jgi:hypothetical protein